MLNPFAIPSRSPISGKMQGQTAQVAKKMALLKKEGVDFNARSVASPDFVLKGSQLSVA